MGGSIKGLNTQSSILILEHKIKNNKKEMIKKMVYEIYELTDEEKKLDVFVIFQTITMSVVEINNRAKIQEWMNQTGLIKENGWDLNTPTQVMDYRQYNQVLNITI